jgi:hypothetical protein
MPLEVVTNFVPRKVTPNINERLCAAFTDMKIESALFMMDPSNSPGKYDFTTDFYIKHCDLLKKDV